jgi:HEPN domain-containing protein
VPTDLIDTGKALDKHYMPARYPNSHPTGAPGDLYTGAEADRAVKDAARIIDYVRSRLPQA